MATKKISLKDIQRADSIQLLTTDYGIKAGDTLFTSVVSVARSGMSRHIKVFAMLDNVPRDITYHVGRVIGYRQSDKTGGLVVGGCGMDMCFQTVYNLSSALFPNGFTCTGRDTDKGTYCSSNDHSNGDRDYTPHHHSSGGYALRKRDL